MKLRTTAGAGSRSGERPRAVEAACGRSRNACTTAQPAAQRTLVGVALGSTVARPAWHWLCIALLSGLVMSTIGERQHRPSGRSDAFAVNVLLACGVLYAVLYAVINDVVAASLYPGYSRLSQAISELSATTAPSKGLLAAMVPVFTLLMIAFGIGVWKAAGGSRALLVTGGLLVAHGATFPLWLLAPMTSRGQAVAAMPANDVGHIVLSAAAVLFILLEIGFGAAAFGGLFRLYSLVTAVTILVFGALTGIQAPGVASGEATPFMGLYERISFAAWLVWLAALAVALLRAHSHPPGPAPSRIHAHD